MSCTLDIARSPCPCSSNPITMRSLMVSPFLLLRILSLTCLRLLGEHGRSVARTPQPRPAQAHQEPTDVGRVRYAARLGAGTEAAQLRDELQHEPQPQQDDRGNA